MSITSSTTIANLSAALVQAQKTIGVALKDKDNPFFQSKYADLTSVVEAIKVPITEAGLTYTQVMHDAENAAKVETIILHSSGEWLSCGCVSVPVSKHDAQGYGSALTYARRYSLSAAFGVVADIDDDGNAAATAAPKKTTAQSIAKANVTPTSGARERLTPERLKVVEKVASEVLDCFEVPGEQETAYDVIMEAELDADEKVALWTYLSSAHRSALAKINKARKELEKAPEPA